MRRTLPPEIEPFPGSQDQDAFAGTLHRCAWKGCQKAGEYRAPKDRGLREHYLFCLDHIRAYNAQWDFHRGLTPAQMEVEMRNATTWGRPTWKLGSLGAGIGVNGRAANGRNGFRIDDPLDLGADTDFDARRKARERRRAQNGPAANTEHARALKILDLEEPFVLDTLRRQYKALVKKYHPDANGGATEAETRMKLINAAYHTLRAALKAAE